MRHACPIAALALLAAACRPDAPATKATHSPIPAPPLTASAPAPIAATANGTDTLHLPGAHLVRLQPSTAAAFNQLPADTVAVVSSTDPDQHLDATQGRVRRQGLNLLLQPMQGAAVRLSSTPAAKFTLANAQGVRYQYLGSLMRAPLWVVQAWHWESDAAVLVDQRTGRHLEQPGHPSASPNGRYVLLCSPGLGGGDQPNLLSLVQVDAAGPHLLWQREPTTWEPNAARWAASNRVVLQLRHANAQGEMTDDTSFTYAELTLPPTP